MGTEPPAETRNHAPHYCRRHSFRIALVFAGAAAADVIPESGYLVFKETRGPSVTEVHAKGTGNLVYSGMSMKKHGRRNNAPECNDERLPPRRHRSGSATRSTT